MGEPERKSGVLDDMVLEKESCIGIETDMKYEINRSDRPVYRRRSAKRNGEFRHLAPVV